MRSILLLLLAFSSASGQINPKIEAFFAAPIKKFETQKIPKGFRIITLNHISHYVYKVKLQDEISSKTCESYFEKIIELCPKIKYQSQESIVNGQFTSNGLFLSHLNIILGLYFKATGNKKYFTLNDKLSKYIASQSLKEPTKHLPSYTNSTLRFPADQTASLYSIKLYDENFNTEISKKPIDYWTKKMQQEYFSTKYNLPFSEVTKGVSYSNIPRGCALSFSCYYMSYFAPKEANKIWETYKTSYFQDLNICGGFREWPKGIDRKADVDSGPIIMGIGLAATGLGILAAKQIKDQETYNKLKLGEAFIINQTKDESILSLAIALHANKL
jgi:hypothetical protein